MHRTRATRPSASRTSRLACALATFACAACQTEPTQNRPRPLDAPFRSAGRIVDQFLSPTAVARDLGDMRDRATQMAKDEADLGDAGKIASQVASRESERARAMADGAVAMVDREQERFGMLAASQGFDAIDPSHDLSNLRNTILRIPRTLQFDRRPLGEPDDVQHRTDPWDNHPEAGWTSRILRRVLP